MAAVISQDQLTAFLPTLAGADAWTAALNAAMDRFEINTPQRAAAFLAQVAHESGEFKQLVESLGNGDEASGDGWRFKGRGLIQLTGRGNYRSCGAAIGLPLETQPEILETREPAAVAEAQFWQSRGLNHLADDTSTDNDDEDFVSITKIINGGTAGLTARLAYWARAKAALG